MQPRRDFIKTLALTASTAFILKRGVGAEDSSSVVRAADRHDFFYRPIGAYCGDFMGYYENGWYYLFYLHGQRPRTDAVSWYAISTQDFVHFREHGEAIPRGSAESQDYSAVTGSVLKKDGKYHAFYCGRNNIWRRRGRPCEAIMHAVSDDLVHWEKLPDDTFYAPADRYERNDWRDPFVFYNGESNEYWMLLAARLLKGSSSRRRGCIALCRSKDLTKWQVAEPFYAPGQYYTHECPDVFRWGDWCYLIYSEFSDRWLTRYRMSRSLHGPWFAPPHDDAFDGHAYYAAKTISSGDKRVLCGFIFPREGDRDAGSQVWGGNLVVHELRQTGDGSLSVKMPDTIRDAFNHEIALSRETAVGLSLIEPGRLTVGNGIGFACARLGDLPNRCRVRLTCVPTRGTRLFGLMLRTASDWESAYYVRVDLERNRLDFDTWPRKAPIPFMVEGERPLERPLSLPLPDRFELEVIMDGSIGVAYLNDSTALSFRMYDRDRGLGGIFCEDGVVTVENCSLWT